MKKFLTILVFSVIVLGITGCSKKAEVKYKNDQQIEKEIIANFTKILEVTDLKSSNPFDYTKNKYYQNIVNLGINAVPVLENMYNKGELLGVTAYLSALIIQDITKCNLYEKYNLDWSTAEEFYNLWKNNNCSFRE